MKTQFVRALNASDAPLLLRVGKIFWEHLPLLLLADLALGLALVPPVIAALIGLELLAPWIAALTLGPVWLATCVLALNLLSKQPGSGSWRNFLRSISGCWRSAVSLSAGPALLATLLLGTLHILTVYPQMRWLQMSLFADICGATLVALAACSAFPLRATRTLRGWSLWKISLAVSVLGLGRLLGVLGLFAALGLLLFVFNAGLLPLLSAPLALCLVALTQQTWNSLSESERNV